MNTRNQQSVEIKVNEFLVNDNCFCYRLRVKSIFYCGFS